MRRSNIGYFLREGIRGLFLHGFMSFAAICVIIACLIIMGSFGLVLLDVNATILKEEQESELLVYIDESLSEAEAKSVGSQINLIPNVLQADFVSREQALEDYADELGDSTLLAGVDASTFRHRYKVTLVDITAMNETVAALEQIPGVADVNAYQELAAGFATIQNILNLVSAAIILVLLVVSLLIIANTVKLALFARREEIAIMKMVGATNGFIRWPFIIEGFLLGMLGAAGAFFLEWALYNWVTESVIAADSIHLLAIVPFRDVLPTVAILFAATGFLVGVVGSTLSIRKFLRV
jgi:cell division transport system permease protein